MAHINLEKRAIDELISKITITQMEQREHCINDCECTMYHPMEKWYKVEIPELHVEGKYKTMKQAQEHKLALEYKIATRQLKL